jgi:hypothetical protein
LADWQTVKHDTSFQFLNGYNKNGGTLIYKFRFKLPAELIATKKPIAIDLNTISLKSYSPYLNEYPIKNIGESGTNSRIGFL